MLTTVRMMDAMRIVADDLTYASVQSLIRLHLDGMHDGSPPESVHALDLDGLRAPGITVWSAWRDEDLLGIGALQVEPGGTEGEIKSMRTHPQHLGQGVARALLRHIIEQAARQGLARLSLETGTDESFIPSHRLYLSEGFIPCGPFGSYAEDPHSCYFTRVLTAGTC
jgi:putative acetyltransferase